MFSDLLPSIKIQFLIGDIGYHFSHDIGIFYDEVGKMFLRDCFDIRSNILYHRKNLL